MKQYMRRASRSLAFATAKPFVKHEAQESLVLFSDPRGGSTWLSEVIRTVADAATIWEPLRPDKLKELQDIGFSWHQHIDEDVSHAEFEHLLDKIFSGRIMNSYLLRDTSPMQLVQAKRLIIKVCNGQNLLPWLTRRFSFTCSPVHLIRHPCAVISSQMKHGAWSSQNETINMEGLLRAGIRLSEKDVSILQNVASHEERHAAVWALNNRIPINHPRNGSSWLTISYEKLLVQRDQELARLQSFWGNSLDFSRAMIDVPSSTTREGSPISAGDKKAQLGYWRSTLSKRQIDAVLQVVHGLGVTVYSDEVLPSQ